MSKVRDLPETSSLDDGDLVCAVDVSAGPNGGRKITKINLKQSIRPTPAEVKSDYESNLDTNAFTDAEKAKLGGIEVGATADQVASEVPYDNSTSGLIASNVKDAIDELSLAEDFRPSIVSGRILHYTGGTSRFDGVFHEIVGGDVLLNSSVTDGFLYLDVDGIVKQTASGVAPPPYTIVIAKFTTNLSSILALEDQRVTNAQNIVRGLSSDVQDVRAGATAVAGSSGRVSDAAHKHLILTAAATGLTAASSSAEGTSTALARADHTHAISTAAPATQTPDQANAAGSSNSFARADHVHQIPTASAASLTTASTNGQGTSSSFARADHTHSISVSNQEVIVTADDTTISLTDVLMVGMTQTPLAGTYLVMWSGSIVNSANGTERTWVSLYAGGTQVSGTERSVGTSGGAYVPSSTHAVVTVNGSQAIEVRWRAAGGTSTVHGRRFTLIRLGA